MKSSLAARAFALGSVFPAAQDPPISTDRPGFLFAPTVVPRGRLQVEAGLPTLTFVRDSGDEVRTWSLPVALRYGLTEELELRASLPAWNDLRDEAASPTVEEEGFADSEVGAKIRLHELSGGPLAFQASLRLPTGEDAFTTDEIGVSAFLLHGRDVGDSTWLQAMVGATHTPIDGAHDATTGALAALVSRPISGRWSAYVEGTALPGLDHAAGQAYAGAALVLAAARDLQLDLSADFGLDDDSADVIAALGVSCRF